MLVLISFVIFHLFHFSSPQNSTNTTASTNLNTTQGKIYHTEEEILRLVLIPKISRGHPATLGEIPYQVALKQSYSHDVYNTFCGASILKPKILLSAAHCFMVTEESFFTQCFGRLNQGKIKTAFAVAGNLKNFAKYSEKDSTADGQWRRLDEVRYPSSYKFPNDDLAIVTLTRSFKYNNNIKPIRIAQLEKDYGGLHCLASGYGRLSEEEMSPNLRKALLQVLPVRTCDIIFGIRTQKMVCTTDRVADVLKGDSGGPLVCKYTRDPADTDWSGVQVGVVSGGVEGIGSLFTRLTAYKDYIARGGANRIIIERLIVWFIPLLRFIAFCII